MSWRLVLEKLTIVCVALQSFELFGCKFSDDALGLCVCECLTPGPGVGGRGGSP